MGTDYSIVFRKTHFGGSIERKGKLDDVRLGNDYPLTENADEVEGDCENKQQNTKALKDIKFWEPRIISKRNKTSTQVKF